MIDLHVHTNNSDGKYTVEEILNMAEKKKINTISFCDHNVVEAYKKLKNIDVKKYFSGKIVTGIEFDFQYKKKNFHILGYKFDINILENSKFIDRTTYEERIKEEEKRLDFFKSVCKKLNIKLTPNLKIENINLPANDIIKEDMQKHKENDKILDDILGKDRRGSFWLGHVTNPKSPFYIDFTKNLPTVTEIADEIHNAGGIVVLPHVFEYKSIDNITFLNEIFNLGILDGIECVHSKHTKEQVIYLKNFCKENKLLMTGGSDFHDDKKQTLGFTELGEISDEYNFKFAK